MPDKIDVLQFMILRSPSVPDSIASRRSYVRDDVVGPYGRRDEDLFSVGSPSAIGRSVYDAVFCALGSEDPGSVRKGIADLVNTLLLTVPHFAPACPNEPGTANIELLRDRTYVVVDGVYYLPPDRLADLETSYGPKLPTLIDLLEQASKPPAPSEDGTIEPLDVTALHQSIRKLFDDTPVYQLVFEEDGEYVEEYRLTKRALFDTLYLLYILRRCVRVHLEPIMDALGALHTLEALASDAALAEGCEAPCPSSATFRDPPQPNDCGLLLVGSYEDLRAHLDAMPVVHPIFARLHRFRHPFNDVSPVGVGDLKVVKQWLLRYKVGEIAHIDNVLIGETKSRVHRHLEKAEEVFTLTSEQQEETTRDTQTSDRFEIKREAENIIKNDLNVTAGLNVSLNVQSPGYTIVSTVTGGLAYSRSQTEQAKMAANFARDVVDKAVKRVQSRISETRTTTKLFETEETNTHTFDNKNGELHISGIYRWLDKEYRSQIYNFGKRMMFEFVLPEPAAFFVESRLRAYETTLEVPQPPAPPEVAVLPAWVLNLALDQITPDRFKSLRITHDLTDLEYPQVTRWVDFIDTATGRNYFTEHGLDSHTWQGRTFNCRLNAKHYIITNIVVHGYVHFWGADDYHPSPDNDNRQEINTFDLRVDGYQCFHKVDNHNEYWHFQDDSGSNNPVIGAPAMADDQVNLFLGFWDVADFDLSVHAEVRLDQTVLDDWKSVVISRVRVIEQKRIDAINTERQQTYQSRLATYRSRIGELRAMAVNDLLQGQSEAFNRMLIVRELKRQCLAMLTKEFDADVSDDTVTDLEAMGTRPENIRYRQLKVTELPNAEAPVTTSAAFEDTPIPKPVDYPAMHLAIARDKARYVQFLEQAFEWQQLSYFCYPYFWATPPKWIELMSRSDDADPFLTAFLQAGSVRVLVAVTPAHDDAVLHYLATGEPWEGGPAPVIGDPLYLPLYEELRRQQDDLANAVPEGESWTFTLPTSLVYLENSSTPLPELGDKEGDEA